MARGGRTKLYVNISGGRDVITPSLTPLPWPKIHIPSAAPFEPLVEIEDRRTYHPDGGYRSARMLSGHSHTPVVIKRAPRKFRALFPFHRQRFAVPEKTLVCIRRQRRREVMFARRKAGRGGQRKPRFNWYSAISCRR